MNDLPVPNKETDLFRINNPGYSIACIQDYNFDTYAMGYLDTCKQILDKMDKDRTFISDTCVYPIVFLFRHFVELKLKQIIIIGKKNKLSPYTKMDELTAKYGHDIVKLWDDAKVCIKTYWKSSIDDQIKYVEKNINALQNKFSDQKGMVFRFPVDTKGKKSFVKNFHIDLKQFKKSIEEIGNFLEGCSEGMIAEKEMLKEMMVEYANEY